MGLKQDLGQLVAAARLAQAQNAPIRFVLAGDGNQRASLVAAAKDLSRIEIRDGVRIEEFPNFLNAADVLLINERAGVMEMSLPSKLTSYLAAGRPSAHIRITNPLLSSVTIKSLFYGTGLGRAGFCIPAHVPKASARPGSWSESRAKAGRSTGQPPRDRRPNCRWANIQAKMKPPIRRGRTNAEQWDGRRTERPFPGRQSLRLKK